MEQPHVTWPTSVYGEYTLQNLATWPVSTLPDHFDDADVVDALKTTYLHAGTYWPFTRSEARQLLVADPVQRKTHPLTCGLVIKLRTALLRLTRRTRLKPLAPPHDTQADRLLRLVGAHVHVQHDTLLRQCWPCDALWHAATELADKTIYLSPTLQEELFLQPLLPRVAASGQLPFNADFLRRVAEYHVSVSRPLGTFTVNGLIDMDVRCGRRETFETHGSEGDASTNADVAVDNAATSADAQLLATMVSVRRFTIPFPLGVVHHRSPLTRTHTNRSSGKSARGAVGGANLSAGTAAACGYQQATPCCRRASACRLTSSSCCTGR